MRRAVHQLEHARPQRRGDGKHRVSGGLDRREDRDERGRGRLRGDQPQRQLGDHAEHALRPDEELGQREPGDVLEPRAAQAQRGAVGQHDLHAEHVVGRHAVLDAAQPAGVRRRVAADRADLERRRVRRVPEPVLGGCLLHLDVEQARLHDRHARHRVDADVAHLLQRQHDAALDRGRPARQPRAGAAGTTGTRCAEAQRSTAWTSLGAGARAPPHAASRRPGRAPSPAGSARSRRDRSARRPAGRRRSGRP